MGWCICLLLSVCLGVKSTDIVLALLTRGLLGIGYSEFTLETESGFFVEWHYGTAFTPVTSA